MNQIPLLPINPATYDEVCNLANQKIQQDYMIRSEASRFKQWYKTGLTCPVFPETFLRTLIPFLYWEQSNKSMGVCKIPTEIAFGACIKGYPEYIAENEVELYKEAYRSSLIGYRWGADASGDYFPDLGFYVASEGKHRVAFMRHHNEPFFLAKVTEARYPEPERIKLIRSDLHGKISYALLDGKHLQLVSSLLYSPVALLKAYGVKTTSWTDAVPLPESFVWVKIVKSGLLEKPPLSRCERKRTFDLTRIGEDYQKHLLESRSKTRKFFDSLLNSFRR